MPINSVLKLASALQECRKRLNVFMLKQQSKNNKRNPARHRFEYHH